MNEKDFAELAAGHALGALSAEDERAFVEALAEHPEWSAIADADADVVARLADSVADVAPPALLKDSLFARLDALEAPAPSAVPVADAAPAQVSVSDAAPAPRADRRPRAHLRSRAWFALAASLALILGVGAGATVLVQNLTTPPAVVALDRIEAAPDAEQVSAEVAGGGEATLHWSEALGEAVLVADGLPSITSDETFELWFVRGETPISAGTFDASSGTTSALLDAGVQPGDVIAVTVEPAGGSPVGVPTSDPIIAIATA